jgi:hypothetical protein
MTHLYLILLTATASAQAHPRWLLSNRRAKLSTESSLILKRASASRLSGQRRDDDYDGAVVGRIFLSPAAPDSRPWM